MASQPPMFTSASFFGAHGTAIGIRKNLPHNRFNRRIFVPLFAQFDKPGILGKPAGIDKQRDSVPFANGFGFPDVLHRNRLTTTRIIGDGKHTNRNIFSAFFLNKSFEFCNVHVPFERMDERWIFAFVDNQINGN
jgi:hypothetical protein